MISQTANSTFFEKAPVCGSTEKVLIRQIGEELQSYSSQCKTINSANADTCFAKHETLRKHIDYYRCKLGISAKSFRHIKELLSDFYWTTVQESIERRTAIQFRSGDLVYACTYDVGRLYTHMKEGLCYFNADTAQKSHLIEGETIVQIAYSDKEEALVALDEDGQAYVVDNIAANNEQFIPSRTKEPWQYAFFERLATFAGTVYAQYTEGFQEKWRKFEADKWTFFDGRIVTK